MTRSGGAIHSFEVFPVRLRLRRPFHTTAGARHHVESVLVRLRTVDGAVGWGEAVPDTAVTGETHEATLSALRGPLAAALVDADLDADLDTDLGDGSAWAFGSRSHRTSAASGASNDPGSACSSIERAAAGCPAACAAVDIAVHDLWARRAGVPLHVLLAREGRGAGAGAGADDGAARLIVSRVVGMAEPGEMAAAAVRNVEDGFSTLKVKVGDPTAWIDDVERVAAVRSAVGPEVGIKVDVNEAWGSVEVAVAALEQMRDSAPMYVEQPIRRQDVEGLAEVRRRVPGVPIMADEAVTDAVALRRLLDLQAVDLINVKLMRVGGLGAATLMIEAAAAAGVGVQIGTMLESSVGSAAGLHLAAASDDVRFVEMGGPLLLAEDVADLVRCYDGERVTLPSGPGLGVLPGLPPAARRGTGPDG